MRLRACGFKKDRTAFFVLETLAVATPGGGRVVPLRALPGMRRQDCRVPRNWQNRWQAFRRAAGFAHWVPDVCRHTFASYHAAHFRNLPELQLEMGHHDLNLLRTRYMMPTHRRAAAQFWRTLK